MSAWRWVGRRLRVLLRKDDVERELDDEMRFHIEMEIREHEARGLSPAEARRRALVEFGGVERFKEEVRDVRGARMFDDLVQDARVALRSLPREPAFTLAVLVTLGLGIGGTVAMYGVLDASVFRTLPYEDADRLVIGRATRGASLMPMVSGFDYVDYRDQATSLEELAAIAPFPARLTVTGAGEAERVRVVQISPNLFRALGVPPRVGRDFAVGEDQPGAPPVVLLSEGYWGRSFGSDPGVVGRTLDIAGVPRTIVGVMPAEARFYIDTDAWIPMTEGEGMAGSRRAHNWLLVGRLREGVSRATAQAEVDGISARLAEAYPGSNEGKGLLLTPLDATLVEAYRTTLLLLGGAVVLLLVVACANVAGLLLARGTARRGEMAVRAALGARRGRLTRQLVTESALLAVGAGALGLVLAAAMQRAMLSYLTMERLGTLEPGISARTVLVALGVSVLTVVLFGWVPALRAADADPAGDIRTAGRGSEDRRGTRLRSGLVVAQVALTALLLFASGLLLRSLDRIRSVPLGFDEDGLVTAQVEVPPAEYSPAERLAFFDALRTGAEGLPGVRSVALVDQLPLRNPGNNWRMLPAEEVGSDDARGVWAHQRVAHPGYFDAMGVPIAAGRALAATDAGTGAVVVSEAFAEELFPGEDPLGRRIAREATDPPIFEIVGVAGDVVQDSPRWGSPPTVYYPFHDRAPARVGLAVRHDGDAAAVVRGLREIVRGLDADVPLDQPEAMGSLHRRSTEDERALALLVAAFGVVALVLAGVGLYGVLAYQVSRRLREIGIRMALGASSGTVSGWVLRGGLALVALGLLVGVPVALASGRLLEGFLFGVESWDPAAFLAGSLFLLGVGAVACLVPAWRASRVDPVRAIRTE